MKDLLKYLEENKNPNLKTEVNYGFEYCLSLINEYQALQLPQSCVSNSFYCQDEHYDKKEQCAKQCITCFSKE